MLPLFSEPLPGQVISLDLKLKSGEMNAFQGFEQHQYVCKKTFRSILECYSYEKDVFVMKIGFKTF